MRGGPTDEPAADLGFRRGLDELASAGLNLVAFVPLEDVVGAGSAEEEAAGEGAASPRPMRGYLLLMAMGPTFGRQTDLALSQHPYDDRARGLARAFRDTHLSAAARQTTLVYPRDASESQPPLDLRGLLARAWAQHLAPFRTGIRPDCGPWLAVRAVLSTCLSPAQITVLRGLYPPLADGDSPCDTCVDRPCVQRCPAGALNSPPHAHKLALPIAAAIADASLARCVEHRLEPDSVCSRQCLARLACPVGAAYRYDDSQIAYHYGVSLEMLRAWLEPLRTP